jgi:hypothetical protein
MELPQGSQAWFEMAGTLMCEAAAQSGLPPELNASLVERYTDGIKLSQGLIQGQRFDIISGKPSFRVGARQDDRTDITVEITAAAARERNTLGAAIPCCARSLPEHKRNARAGKSVVNGRVSRGRT